MLINLSFKKTVKQEEGKELEMSLIYPSFIATSQKMLFEVKFSR